MKMTETQIQQWADTYDARGKLPILIRRLVQETVSNESIEKIFFRGDSGVDLSGVDGKTISKIETDKVPQDTTYWEFGTNNKFKDKANDDYNKRTAEFSEEERLKSTFIFVTPRRWTQKEDWEKSKNNKKKWKQVKVYDSTDIAIWLEKAPITTCWLCQELNIPTQGLISPERWWNNWAVIDDKKLNYELITSRRDSVKENLVKLLKNKVSTINLFAENIEEGTAFVVATLLQNPQYTDLLNSTIIVNSKEAQLLSNNSYMIVINLAEDDACLSAVDKNKITIVRILPLGLERAEREIENKIVLSYVPREKFISELKEIGFTEEESLKYAQQSRLSIPVLRRLLSKDEKIKLPAWAQDIKKVNEVIPFAFCGAYNRNKMYNDLSALNLLTDGKTENNLEKIENELLILPDPPIIKLGTITTVISTKDIFYVLSTVVTNEEYDKFFELAELIFSERKPSIDLPKEKRWAANIFEKNDPFSPEFIKGFSTSFCYLSNSNDYCKPLATKVIRNCMTDITKETWYSIEEFLPVFAEAAPTVFLECLEKEIFENCSTIEILFEPADPFNHCLRSNLLWALEKLAWYPEYFKRVVIILLELCKFQLTDNIMNTPFNSLYSLFRFFLPDTMVQIEDKIVILKKLANDYPEIIFNLCLRIINNRDMAVTRNITPQWMEFNYSMETQKVTTEQYYAYIDDYTEILLSLYSNNTSKLHELLKISDKLSIDNLKKIIIFLTQWEITATDEDKNSFSMSIYDIITQDKMNEEYEILFRNILELLKPKTLTAKYYNLFTEGYLCVKENNCSTFEEYQQSQKNIEAERKKAIIELIKNLPRTEIIKFILSLPDYNNFILLLFNNELPSSEYLMWFNDVYLYDNSFLANDILRTILYQAYFYKKEELFTILTEDFSKKENIDKERLATLLPGNSTGWQVAYSLGDSIVQFYWENNIFIPSPEYLSEDVQFAVTNFLKVNRPSAACLYALYKYDTISISAWIMILFKMVEHKDIINDNWLYHLEPIFLYIDTEQEKYKYEIIKLEILYYKIIFPLSKRFHNRVPLIYKELSIDPYFFIQLNSFLYQQDFLYKKALYEIFRNWNILPGSLSPQEEQEKTFLEWNKIIKDSQLNEKEYRGYQLKVSNLLAKYAYSNRENNLLEEYLINFIEQSGNEILQQNFSVLYNNARGVFCRGINEGGKQERELAKFYEIYYEKYKIHHPIFANIIKEIISDLLNWAAYEDDRANYEERLN